MKKIFVIILILQLIFCAKHKIKYPNSEDIDWQILYRNLQLPYEFQIKIIKPFVKIEYDGKKDAIGNIELKGYMSVRGEKNIKYNVIYDRKNWYDKERREILYDTPINPKEIIENMIIENTFKSIKNNVYFFNANIAFIDPFNYNISGKIKIQNGKIYEIKIDSNDIKIDIKIKYNNTIMIKNYGKVIKTFVLNANNTQKNILNHRLSISQCGEIDRDLQLFKKYDFLKEIIEIDSARIGTFQYTEPFENNNDKLLNNDERNTCKIIEDIYSFTGNEDIILVEKGPKYDIMINNMNIPEKEKLCLYIGKLAFYIENTKNTIIIKNIQDNFIGLVFSIIKYPYKGNIKIFTLEE